MIWVALIIGALAGVGVLGALIAVGEMNDD